MVESRVLLFSGLLAASMVPALAQRAHEASALPCQKVIDPGTGAFTVSRSSETRPGCTYGAEILDFVNQGGAAIVYYFDSCTDEAGLEVVSLSSLDSDLEDLCGGDSGSQAAPGVALPRLRSKASGSAAAAGQAAQGAVAADFNGDGAGDFAYVANGAVVVQLGTSGGLSTSSQQFALPFATSPGSNQMVAADFNGDGKIDLAVSTQGNFGSDAGGVAILLGKGDGTFGVAKEYPAGNAPLAIAASDFNGDGKVDIAAASSVAGSVAVMFGSGDGTFGTPTTYPAGQGFPQALVAVDLNGDGLPDLAIANAGVTTLLNAGGGKFSAAQINSFPAGNFTPYLAYADLNHDGHEDVILVSQSANAFLVYLGKGDGTFQSPAAYTAANNPGSMSVIPLEDGNTFLVTADPSGTYFTQVSPAGAVGAPALTPIGGKPTDVAVADLAGKGQTEAVITGASSDVTVGLLAGGQFSVTAGYSLGTPSPQPESVAVGDLNGDGRPDLIVGTAAGTVAVLLGNGDATFQAPATTAVNQNAGGLALADFNGDGKLDVAVAAFGTYPGFVFTDAGGVDVLLGNGNGTFQAPLILTVNGLQPEAIAAGDLNGDGIPDLAVLMLPAKALAPGAATLAVFLGAGGGKFQAARTFPLQATGLGPGGGIAIGDLNADGKADIAAVSSYGEKIDILLGDGSGNFHEPSTIPSSGTSFAYGLTLTDLNGDGKLDLVIPNCCGATEATFFPGNGDGTFGSEQGLLSGASPSAVAVTQFSGNPGLVFVNQQGKLVAMEFGPVTVTPAGPAIAADTSAASSTIATLAPGSIATAYGTDLATGPATAGAGALPATLGGTQVSVTDSTGTSRAAGLFYVSQTQVNYEVPDGTATGAATVTITSGSAQGSASVQIAGVSPGIFQLNASGLAAVDVIVVGAGGAQTFENVYQVNSVGAVVALPIDLSAGAVYLAIYGTGLRNAGHVTATVGGQSVPVLAAGAQGQYAGLDQVNIGPLPGSLKGPVNLVVTADGKAANVVNLVVE